MGRKNRSLCEVFQGEFQATFGTNAATIAVVVNGDQKRVDDLKRWTENELKSRQLDELADIFCFALYNDALTAAELFCSPYFAAAFSSFPDRLLPIDLSLV